MIARFEHELQTERSAREEALLNLHQAREEMEQACMTRDKAEAAMRETEKKQARFETLLDEIACSKVALEAANGSAEAQIHLLGSRICELELSLEANEKSLEEKEVGITSLTTAKDLLEAKLAATDKVFMELSAASDALTRELRESEVRATRLQEELIQVVASRNETENLLLECQKDNEILKQAQNETTTVLQSSDELNALLSNLEADKETLSSTIRNHQATIDSANVEVDTLTKRVEALAAEKKDLIDRLEQNMEELKDMTVARDTHKDSLNKTESQILMLEAKVLQLETSTDNRSNELLQEARNTALALEDELAEKERQLNFVHNRLSQCEDEIEMLREDSHTSSAVNEGTNDELFEKYEKLESDYKQVVELLEKERSSREESETELKRIMGDEQRLLIQEAETRMAALKSGNKDLEQKLTESEAEAYAAREANEKYRDHSKRAEKESKRLGDEIEALKEEIGELSQTLKVSQTQSNAEITRLVSSINTCKAELYASKQTILDLTERIRLSTATEESASREAGAAREKVAELESRLEATATEKDALNTELKKLKSNIENEGVSSGGNDNPALKSKLKELSKEIEARDRRIKKLEAVRLTNEQVKSLKKLKVSPSVPTEKGSCCVSPLFLIWFPSCCFL